MPDDAPKLPHVLVRILRVTDVQLVPKYETSCTCGWKLDVEGKFPLYVYEAEGDESWEKHLVEAREDAARRAHEIVCKFTGETP